MKRTAVLACATLAMLALAASATATGERADTHATPAAEPFAVSWASVPRTPAARQAKDVLVFGAEQDINGFNANLTCCNQFWGAVMSVPVIRGAYNLTDTLDHVKDLVSDAKATKTTLTFT